MTWDEAELRAALREGEGETLSAGHIVALGQARQQRRHDRMRTAAVAVVVTGLIGGGVGVLTQLSGNGESGSSASANGAKAGRNDYAQAGAGAAQGPESSPRGSAVHGALPLAPVPSPATSSGSQDLTGVGTALGSSGSTVACPKTVPAVSRFTATAPDSTGPLFAEPVTSIAVCGYRAGKPGEKFRLRGSTILTGSAAGSLAADLERLPTTARTTSCAVGGSPILLTVRADASGDVPLSVVTVVGDVNCGATVTNGTAVRYAWTIPKLLAGLTR